MRKIAYTCVIGNYDTPRTPTVMSDGWEYICFTDDPKPVEGWKMVKIEPFGSGRDSILQARWIKTLYFDHIDCDICLWTDANIQIRTDLNDFADRHKSEFVTMKHPKRNSIYEESKACLHATEQLLIKAQIESYMGELYYADNGLVSSGILLRRDNENVRGFCEEWFNEIDKYSIRDQLSFNYVLWKHPLDIETIPYHELMKEEFNIRPHVIWQD